MSPDPGPHVWLWSLHCYFNKPNKMKLIGLLVRQLRRKMFAGACVYQSSALWSKCVCVSYVSLLKMFTTPQDLPPVVWCGRWPECPRLCPARFENLRMESTRLCHQTCVSDDGLTSLAALWPQTLSTNGSNVAPSELKAPGNTAFNFPFSAFLETIPSFTF